MGCRAQGMQKGHISWCQQCHHSRMRSPTRTAVPSQVSKADPSVPLGAHSPRNKGTQQGAAPPVSICLSLLCFTKNIPRRKFQPRGGCSPPGMGFLHHPA